MNKFKVKQAGLLSDYPSEAIRQAVEDIQWVEEQDSMKVNMYTYGRIYGDKCHVCQAGAVAMRRAGYIPGDGHLSEQLSENKFYRTKSQSELARRQIKSFDHLRKGLFGSFLNAWIEETENIRGLKHKIWSSLDVWCEYDQDPTQYKKNLLKIADILEKEGY